MVCLTSTCLYHELFVPQKFDFITSSSLKHNTGTLIEIKVFKIRYLYAYSYLLGDWDSRRSILPTTDLQQNLVCGWG